MSGARSALRLALLGATCLATLLPSTAARSADRVVVAWDDVALQGRVAALQTTPPYAFVTPALAVGADGSVRASRGRVFHLSRTTGVLSRIDPVGWTLAQSYALGAAGEPRDVAFVGADTAYVSRRGARYLLRLNLATGAATDAVDLAPLGAGDGDPAQETMLVHGGRLYLGLAGEPGFPPSPHSIAVIDLASETLVDVDPGAPGVQGIALSGTGPRFKMQLVPGSHRLMVSATGAFHDDGGLELIDLDALESLGLIVREQIDAGADVGGFTLIDGERGWMVFSTDLLLSSHFHAFTLTGGMTPEEPDQTLNYFATALVYDPATHAVFWPEPDGVQAHDADTGTPLAPATPVSGIPTDLELLPSAAVSALPAWAAIALTALLTAAAWRRLHAPGAR